jgi:signal transduction histidine kinase
MSAGTALRPEVAVLTPDPEEARNLATWIVEDGLVPRVVADAPALLALLDGPRPPDVLLLDPSVPGTAAAVDRAGAPGGPTWVALGRKPAGHLGAYRPVPPATLSRRLAWALHARGIAAGAATAAGDELRTLSSLATLLNAGTSGRIGLRNALVRFVEQIGADSGRLAFTTPGLGPGFSEIASYGAEPLTDSRPHPVLSWCISRQRPVRIAGPIDDYPQFVGIRLDPPVAELLVAPVVSGQETVGVLAVGSRVPGRLGPEKLALVITAARLVAGSVQRGRLERAREHQDRLAMLGRLAAGVAHELSNPLAYVSSNLGYLADRLRSGQFDPGDLREVVEETRDGVRRMIGLVEDLRSAGRRGRGDDCLVDLDALARRAAVLVGAQFKHRVEFRVEAGNAPLVQAEGERLLQILLNLLINAGQAMDRRGTAVVRTGVDGPFALVEVEDDGPGVPEELAARIFEPFFTTKAETEGTGLGLSISLQIARSYGGDITVARAPGGGARFTLRLPYRGGPAEQPALERAG